jgi:hypothetical protein
VGTRPRLHEPKIANDAIHPELRRPGEARHNRKLTRRELTRAPAVATNPDNWCPFQRETGRAPSPLPAKPALVAVRITSANPTATCSTAPDSGLATRPQPHRTDRDIGDTTETDIRAPSPACWPAWCYRPDPACDVGMPTNPPASSRGGRTREEVTTANPQLVRQPVLHSRQNGDTATATATRPTSSPSTTAAAAGDDQMITRPPQPEVPGGCWQGGQNGCQRLRIHRPDRSRPRLAAEEKITGRLTDQLSSASFCPTSTPPASPVAGRRR